MLKMMVSYFVKRISKDKKKPYRYGKGLKKIFPCNTTPIVALDFVRELGFLFRVGITEVEILLLLNLEEFGMTRDNIVKQIYHAKEDHVKNLLRNMRRKGLIHEHKGPHNVINYAIADTVRHQIKSLHK